MRSTPADYEFHLGKGHRLSARGWRGLIVSSPAARGKAHYFFARHDASQCYWQIMIPFEFQFITADKSLWVEKIGLQTHKTPMAACGDIMTIPGLANATSQTIKSHN